ncbi:MAG TPA: DNA topoisomerase IB [Aliidongia sp.]|nr:DNA topoisomerase IB [Aliidongia sp.]
MGALKQAVEEDDGAAVPAAIVATTIKLLYVTDQSPGITRQRTGRGWCYRTPDGAIIRDAATLARIRSLAIPPAYRHVWISPEPNGHIQASGRDARGRKQYRYHAAWREFRDSEKYERVATFIRCLPALRARVAADMAKRGLPREKVIATIVRLMETTFIRIGNPEYARQNKSFGLTTLRNRHAAVKGGRIELSFLAKSGIKRNVIVRNRQLVRLIRQLRELPGQELFQFLDEDGVRHTVGSADVNEYLREVSGEEITAKDYRTWAGTYQAIMALIDEPPEESEAARKRALLRAVETVAEKLGNTRAVCRKCYIHPAVLDAHMTGELIPQFRTLMDRAAPPLDGLTAEETAILAFIEARQPSA